MRKTFSGLLLALVAAAPLFGLATPTAKAASLNTAIRGQSALTVYWYATDGKRYTFPTANTYFTWFPSFDTVVNITDAELAAIPLGNQNVTYRPGAKLVKIVSDPKVYAVSRGGILRHVTSESLAAQLYGSDWNLKVHDIPVEFFTNYTVGASIYSASDYNVSNEYNGVSIPSDSFRGATSGSQTGMLRLIATSETTIASGQVVHLVATNVRHNSRLQIIDTRNNTVVQDTETRQNSFISVTLYPQRINPNDSQVQYEARLLDISGHLLESALGPIIYFSGSQTGSLVLNADRTSIASGQAVNLTANYTGTLSGTRIEITEVRTGSLVRTCYEMSSCSVTVYPVMQTGYNSVQYLATVKNSTGSIITTQYSPVIYFDGSTTGGQNGTYQHDGVNYINGLTLQVSDTSIQSGEMLKLTANAFNAGNWSYVGNRIEIRDLRNGAIVKTCNDQSWCVADLTVYRLNSESTVQYEARIYDRNGRFVMSQMSPVVYFEAGGTNNPGTGGNTSGTFSANVATEINPNQSLRTNQTVYVTANVTNANVANANLIVRVYDERSSTPIATCNGTTSCVAAVWTGSSPISTRVYAVATSNTLSGSVESNRVQLTTTN